MHAASGSPFHVCPQASAHIMECPHSATLASHTVPYKQIHCKVPVLRDFRKYRYTANGLLPIGACIEDVCHDTALSRS